MEYGNNSQRPQDEINAYDFVGGYLGKEDLDGPILVTIQDVRQESVEGSTKPKLVVSFDELVKPLILNSTNIRTIAEMVGTGQTSAWIGTRLRLYVDPNVVFSGRTVGGIRVDDPRVNGQTQAPHQHRRNQAPDFL